MKHLEEYQAHSKCCMYKHYVSLSVFWTPKEWQIPLQQENGFLKKAKEEKNRLHYIQRYAPIVELFSKTLKNSNKISVYNYVIL